MDTIQQVVSELERARRLFPRPFASAHEGFAILREEVDELWELVRGKQGKRDAQAMRIEAIQIAAMAIRFAEEGAEQ